MALLVSLAALQKGSVELEGELTPEDLALDTRDPCVRAHGPIRYGFTAQMMGGELFVQGWLETVFACQCVRCLATFEYPMRLDPWACLLPLEGEDALPVERDSVDLTPQIREDSLLALPQHPVCNPECRGLPVQPSESKKPEVPSDETRDVSSAWSILDTLKLDE